MPVFGEYETNDEPLAVTPTRNQTTTVWLARKSGAQDARQLAVKSLAIHRDERTHTSDETLGADPGLEFIETLKQLKKAQSEGCRGFAPVHAFGTSDLGCWYATDFCARGSLKTWINLRGGVDSDALRQVVSSLAEGCRSLKKVCGRSHGNLKPSNILLHGKSRPLKFTLLLMVDPVPVSTTRVAGMASDNQMMVQNIFEAQDLRSIGELILQLVEGRLIESGSDYNFPVESSPDWQKLGKDESRWRQLCNRLIDPQLDLEKTNLDWLAKAFPAGGGMQKLLVPIAAGAVAVAVVAAVISLFMAGRFQRHVRDAETDRNDGDLTTAAQEIQKALKMRPNDPQAVTLSGGIFDDLVKAGQKEVSAGNWNTAQDDLDAASALKPNDPSVARLNERLQHGKAYQAAMEDGQQAFENKNYDEAIRQAEVAMQNSPQDVAAEQLKSDAENAKKAIEMQASGAREQGYETAMSAVRNALGAGNYDKAIRQADTALDYKPDDAEASRLKAEAESARDAAAAKAAAVQQAYQTAMQDGRRALENNKYDEAISQATIALQNVPGDSDAIQLEKEAERQKLAAAAQAQQTAETQARQQQYQAAMSAARAAMSDRNYGEAIRQAQTALSYEPGDPDATKLQNDAAHRQKYDDAMAAGRAALSNKQYDEAGSQAAIALGVEPGDADATQLKIDAANAAARQQKYAAAMAAGNTAFQNGSYDTAIAQAKVALENEPDDPDATQLENNAADRIKEIEDAKIRRQNYTTAMAAARDAYSKRLYADAISDADTALANEPDDAPAAQLRADAVAKKKVVDDYNNAMAAGNQAFSGHNYEEAIRQAKIALEAKPGDAAATKLQTDSVAGLDTAYLATAKDDLAKGNYQEAMQYAKAAMAIKDDPTAESLQTQAETEQRTVSNLDGQLSILMKYFGVDQERGSNILPNAKAAKVAEIDDPRMVTQYLMLTTNLEASYTKGGWLDLEKRRDLLQHIRKNLNNY
ncbi:MAG TPA: tetratricopeptide repeat protein [Candidatus Sulfotelmatobacter sp.]|nr:tetratricopeptide repeat protein [Candidatus Sulfotelmatobacter sp.]